MESTFNSAVVPPPYRSAKTAADWNTFFDAVQTAFALHVKETPFEGKSPVLVEDFPKMREGKFDTDLDVILWRVFGSVMAPTDNANRRVPNGLRVMGDVQSPTKLGYREVTVGWWELLCSEFQIYSKTNARANKLAVWFHRFMMQYAFSLRFFKAYGVTYFKFEGRLPDEKTQDFGEELYVRKLRYEARISLQNVMDAKTLEGIDLRVGSPTSEIQVFHLNHEDGQ
jgi:hypothetical protein